MTLLLLTGLSLLLQRPLSPLPLISPLSYIAARPPGAERVLLRPFLPVLIMLVSQTGLPPPLPLKPRLSLLSVLPHPSLARIPKPFFKTSRISLYVPRITLHITAGGVLMSLAQQGTTVTLLTRTSRRYEGVVASTESEGDTTGVTLRDAKELTSQGAPVVKSHLFIASTNIESWSPVPASSNSSGLPPSTTNSRAHSKERSLLQALAGLTVCDINKAHIAFVHPLI